MMIYKMYIKFALTITILFNLTACNIAGIKQEDVEKPAKVDLLELRKQADISYSNDDLVASERDYLILVKEIPEEALHWFRLGNIFVRTNRPEPAINMYREAVIRDPKYSKAWFNLSIVELKQTAHSLNQMLIYTDPDDPLYIKAKKMLEDIQTIIQKD